MKILINKKLEKKVNELAKEMYYFKFNKDDAILLLNKICYGTYNKSSIDDDGFVSLCSDILIKTIGKNYNQYLNIFKDNKIIDKTNYCTSCHTCNRFRINEYWLDSQLKEYEIGNYSSKKRISKHKTKRIMPSITKKYNHLWRWFNSDKFKLNTGLALKELQKLNLSKDKFRSNINSIYNFKNGNIWFIRHNKDKRIHTNLTNMKSEVRKFLTYDDETLINIDIKNSQIYFLLSVITNNLYNKDTYIIPEYSLETLCSKEIKRFKYLVLNGIFYTHLGNKLIKEKGTNGVYELRKYSEKYKGMISKYEDDPRKLMKSVTFEILFSDNKSQSSEKKWFKKEFPTIMAFVEEIKREDHNKLALLLQNIEAEAVLDIATKNIHKYDKNIPMFTIHDSIMTIKEHVETVERIFKESLLKITGFNPKLNIE